MRRVAAGVAGWVVGVLPLVGVNIAGYANLLSPGDAVLAGAAALLGGIILGGIVAGALAGRQTGGQLSGGIAAVLYAGSLIAALFGAGTLNSSLPLLTLHPLRVSFAIAFLAALLLAVALLTATLRRRSPPARGSAPVAARSRAQPPEWREPQAPPRRRPLPSAPVRATARRPLSGPLYPDTHSNTYPERRSASRSQPPRR